MGRALVIRSVAVVRIDNFQMSLGQGGSVKNGCWWMAKSETRRRQQDVHKTFFFPCNIVSSLLLWLDDDNECSLFSFFLNFTESLINSGISKEGLIFHTRRSLEGEAIGEVSVPTMRGRWESL